MADEDPWDVDPEDPISAHRQDLPSTQRRLSRFAIPSFRRELGKAIGVLVGGAVVVVLVWFTLNVVREQASEPGETTTTIDVTAAWRDRYGAEVEDYHAAMSSALRDGCLADLPQQLDWVSARAAAAPEPFSEWAFHVVVAQETAERALEVCGRNPDDGAEGIIEADEALDRAIAAYPEA